MGIASRKGSSRGETQGALLASAKKARDVILAGAPLAQLPSSLYCSLLAYPSPFHWHLRAMVATYLTLRGIATCLQLPLAQILDCTKFLGAVGWESKEGEEGSLLLEGEGEGGKLGGGGEREGGSFSSMGGGRGGEKFLFINL